MPLGRASSQPQPARSVQEMALDTLAATLRILGEHALDRESMDAETFARVSEQWAQHVLYAAAPPGSEVAGSDARRDWTGVREFVRGYCKESSTQARTVIGDLRQVVWVFIQNLNRTVSHAAEADDRIRTQLARLEAMAQGASTSDLKREVLETVASVTQVMEDRKRSEHERVRDLGARVRQLGEELETARKESEIDPLTKLFNRKVFDSYLVRTVEISHAFEQPACMMLVDLDRFKPINDTFGHQTGDAVLSTVADVLSRTFLRKNDLVARYGGDELAVILRETQGKDGVMLAERLLRGVRAARVERAGKPLDLDLTVSVGVAQLAPGETPAAWLARTDRALYEAKNGGRNRAVAAAGT